MTSVWIYLGLLAGIALIVGGIRVLLTRVLLMECFVRSYGQVGGPPEEMRGRHDWSMDSR